MESNAFSISLEKNPLISIRVIPGHFTTNNAHLNNYLDVSTLKSSAMIARDVARELAIPYKATTPVDTIVCMERTEVIGAYLAEELVQEGTAMINAGREIHIVTPTNNANGNMVFLDNVVEWVSNRHAILLAASVSSGRAVQIGMDCIAYYGGMLVGTSAVFVAEPEKLKHEIHYLFSQKDIPGYKLFSAHECDLCNAGIKLDALVSSDGYTKM